MNSASAKTVCIVYYDGTGKHTTTPCNSISMDCVNFSVPSTKEPTVTYTLWFGDEDDCTTEQVTVPLVHSIVPV